MPILMDLILLVHIAGASIALAAGFVAIAAPKGAAWHRKSGMVFVYGMLTMAILAVFMSAVRGGELLGNIPPGLFAIYLVVRGTKAVRPPGPAAARQPRPLHVRRVLHCNRIILSRPG